MFFTELFLDVAKPLSRIASEKYTKYLTNVFYFLIVVAFIIIKIEDIKLTIDYFKERESDFL